ncbi:MAG: MGH1-like glycoside hydrolase domain-containing protein [Acidobacteriota bacterium]
MPTSLDRRTFFGIAAAAATRIHGAPPPRAEFRVEGGQLQKRYDAAVAGLAAHTLRINRFPAPVLIEGGNYPGVWLECAPLEGLIWGVAANHDIFFDFQREDGYIPCYVWRNKTGTAQIQMVVPIAATAFEEYNRTGDREFLERAYRACSRWDAWLAKYRNTRGAGLCEAFCEYDTGHDGSPRFQGKPRECPNEDARLCPKVDGLPYLAPDLSASVYGGRMALAAMARELGRADEATGWLERARVTRTAILDHLYDPGDACFYDLDAHGRFVRIRGDLLTRVLGEHVVTREMFETIWRKQIGNPAAFWTPYPFPSIAYDDPAFVRPIPRNSWGGASQALTALRAPRWMEHYGKRAGLTRLMRQWVKAIVAAPGFLQQMDPQTGVFTPDGGPYSPAMLVLFDFAWRLYGVRRQGAEFEWNCRLPEGAAACRASLGAAQLATTRDGSELTLDGRTVLHVLGACRVVTDAAGKPLRLIGTEPRPTEVTLGRNTYQLAPDSVVGLA